MATTIAASLRRLSSTTPTMQINISNPQTTWTTSSTISGTVLIATASPTPYSNISITLEGKALTEMERVPLAGSDTRIKTSHNFLKLLMPIDRSLFPQGELPAGQTYEIPFTFVIPSRLLPNACNHKTVGDWVHEDHMQMPPSMGAPLPGLEDMSTQMAKVVYSLNAKIFSPVKASTSTAKSPALIAQISKPLHIIPTSSELPPLTFDLIDNDYILSTSKSLRKSFFKGGKLGTITLSSAQPASFISTPLDPTASTVAHLHLHFVPSPSAPQTLPPKLSTLTTKIKSATFYSIRPHESLPTLASMVGSWDLNRSVYEQTTPLSTRDVGAVSWTPVPVAAKPPTYLRRHSDDSGYSTSSSLSSVSHAADNDITEWQATIAVPVMLTAGKSWLPSFQSCLVGRTYQLEFTASVFPGGFGTAVNLTVKVPVQVAVTGPSKEGDVQMVDVAQVELPGY